MKLKNSIEQAGADEGRAGGAFISSRFRNPEAEIMASRGKPDILGLALAVFATVLLLVTAVVVYMNWDAIRFA
jgi:hypothetical protein